MGTVRKGFVALLLVFSILTMGRVQGVYASASYWDGGVDTSWYTGKAKEYTLKTVQELKGLSKLCAEGKTFSGVTVKLGADIVLNKGSLRVSESNAGYSEGSVSYLYKGKVIISEEVLQEWEPINGFRGTFEGNGHYISGLYVKGGQGYGGLFGFVSHATLTGIELRNSVISLAGGGASACGGIVGLATDSTIEGCFISRVSVVTEGAGSAGGICGELCSSEIYDCFSQYGVVLGSSVWSGDLSSIEDTYIGGICGYAEGCTDGCLDHCTVRDVTVDMYRIDSSTAYMRADVLGCKGLTALYPLYSCVAVRTYKGGTARLDLVERDGSSSKPFVTVAYVKSSSKRIKVTLCKGLSEDYSKVLFSLPKLYLKGVVPGSSLYAVSTKGVKFSEIEENSRGYLTFLLGGYSVFYIYPSS